MDPKCGHYGSVSYTVQFNPPIITEACLMCKTKTVWTREQVDHLTDKLLKEQFEIMFADPRLQPIVVNDLLAFSISMGRAARRSLETYANPSV